MKKLFISNDLETRKLSMENMKHSKGGFLNLIWGMIEMGMAASGTLARMSSLKNKR